MYRFLVLTDCAETAGLESRISPSDCIDAHVVTVLSSRVERA
jgi:hypothetical protein